MLRNIENTYLVNKNIIYLPVILNFIKVLPLIIERGE